MIARNANQQTGRKIKTDAHQKACVPSEAREKGGNLKTLDEALDALEFLHGHGFISTAQTATLHHALKGEERQAFIEMLVELERTVRGVPLTYGQDGAGDEAIAYLHYFLGGCDWYITERDREREQRQAFGLACVQEVELGYINIEELVRHGAELDFHFTPCSLRQILAERR